MPPKGKKGRKGYDSDDDPLADQLAHLKMQAPDTDKQDDAPSNNKKEKKKTKGNKHSDDEEEHTKPQKETVAEPEPRKDNKKDNKKKGKRGHSDDEEEETSTAPTATSKNSSKSKGGKEPVVEDKSKGGKAPKKDKKKGGKHKYSSDEDSDVDPLKAMKAVASKGSDNEEEDEEEEDSDDNKYRGGKGKQQPAPKAAPAPAPANNKKDKKKDKKGNNKGNNKSDDDDVDPLAKLKQLASANDSDNEEEDEEEVEEPVVKATPVKKSAAVAEKESKSTEKNSKSSSSASKDSGKKSKGGKQAAVKEENSDESEGEDAEEEEVEEAAPVVVSKDKNKSKGTSSSSSSGVDSSNSKAATAPVAAPAVETAKATPSKTSSVPAAAAAPVKVETVAPPAPVAVKPVVAAAAEPPVAPAAAAAAAAPKKAKSKLELKLEAAKKEKEVAAEKAAEAARVEAAAAAERERLRLEEEQRLAEEARVKAEADKAARLAAGIESEESDSEDDDDDEDDSEDEQDGKKAATAAAVAAEMEKVDLSKMTPEEREKHARMMSTMYGDDVFSEYANPNQGAGEDEEGEAEEGVTASGRKKGKDKLSNKAKRKLAKEAEAKEREKEFNAAAMKASIEGAQFAVSQSIIDPNDPQWQNALDIIIPSVSISAHSKELFLNTEVNIIHGRRYGLVGPNGAGKSTLLKMISSGELKVPPRVDFLYVEQEVLADETPAVDSVLKADKVRWALIQEEKKLLAELEKKADDAKDQRLGEIYEQLNQIGAAAAESKARRILFGLGFDREMQIRPTKYFSGGWRMRISLARALFIEPTLLMLDEPTNHLDLNAVIWLDDYLQKWKKTLLVVSHDQDFLNSVCQEIIHLDCKKLVPYRGNYDNFKEQEEVKRKQVLKEYEKQEKKLREMKAKGVTKQNAEKAQVKAKSREPGARSKKADAAAVASGGVSSGDTQVTLIARPKDYTVVFSFPEVVQISPPILEVRDVNFQYGPNLPWLFRGLNFGLDMSSRVCIVGPNGSGKSTVIKLITEELKPPEGEVRRNPRLRVGVYNQHFVDRLPMEEDPVTYLRRLYPEETYQSCRNKLGKYGLEGHAHTIAIRDLSGGQKARVVFVELSLMAPHLLFLDEPTNNLDIESIDALCIALKEFNGGVVLVSHDARLIETTECQLWVVEDQNVTPWSSGFTGYRQHLLAKLEEQLQAIMPGSGERPV